MTIVLPISPVLLHLGPTFKCLYICFRCLGTFWQIYVRGPPYWISRWPLGICFLHYIVSHFLLHFGRKIKESLYLINVLLCEHCHHMAAISNFKAATFLDMQFSVIDRCRLPCQLSLRNLFYLHFVQMAAIFNFTVTAALPVLFSVIEHTKIPVHVSEVPSPTYSRFHHICKVGCIPGLP